MATNIRQQHFLTNQKWANIIVNELNLVTCNKILEIGSGKGYLTKHLQKYNYLVLCEINKRRHELLSKYCTNIYPNFLKIPLSTLTLFDCFVGNLPYRLTKKIFRILQKLETWNTAIFLIQFEVGEKLVSKILNKLNLSINNIWTVSFICKVNKEEFFPKPKVDGCLIKITHKPLTNYDNATLQFLLKLFLYPRKSLRALSKKLKVIVPVELQEKRPNAITYLEFDQLYRLNRK